MPKGVIRKCSVEGCEGKHNAKGLCGKHYAQWRNSLILESKYSIVCRYCGKSVPVIKSMLNKQFCDKKCYGLFLHTQKPWNSGLTKGTDERVKKNGENVKKALTGRIQSRESVEKRRRGLTLAHQNIEFGFTKENRPSRTKESYIEAGQKVSKTLRKLYKNKDIVVWNKGLTKETDERIAKIARESKARTTALWKNPDFLKKQIKAKAWGKINKSEQKLRDNFLSRLFPEEYTYTGDGSVIIDGCLPDFTNCNGQKKVIQLHGDYWHCNPRQFSADYYHKQRKETAEEIWKHDSNIVERFKKFGYSTLVVWEEELDDRSGLSEKLTRFHNNNNLVEEVNIVDGKI